MRKIYFLILFLSLSNLVIARALPNDSELKAAYCLKIYQGRIQMTVNTRSMGPEFQALHDKSIDREKRLRSYLLPKLQSLDINALMVASKRAEEDMDTGNFPCIKAFRDKEATISPINKKQTFEEIDQCLELIQKSEISRRIASCDDLTWLPF